MLCFQSVDIKSRLLFAISWFRGRVLEKEMFTAVALCLAFSSSCRNLAENTAIMENCIQKTTSYVIFMGFFSVWSSLKYQALD